MNQKKKTFGLFWMLLLLLPSNAFADLTFEGNLVDANGDPLTGTITVNLKLKSPGVETCLLYEENHTVTVGAGGYVALSMGSGSRVDALPHTFSKAFENHAAFSSLTCGTGTTYSPATSDKRKLFVKVGAEEMGSMDINPPAMALSAANVGGFSASHLLRVESAGVPQVATALTPAQFTELNALLGGTSTRYMTSSGSNGAVLPLISGNPGSPTTGMVWYDTVSNQMKYYDGAVQSLGGGGTVTSVTGTAPISVTGSTNPVITMTAASSSSDGYLSATNFQAFNNKLSNSLFNGQLWMGNGSNIATAVTVSGDATIASNGNISVNRIQGMNFGLSAPSMGQLIKFNGSAWINQHINANEINLGTSDVSFGTGSPNSIRLMVNSTEKMTIDSSGNVGIGTSAPAAKLQVAGQIVSQEYIVSTGANVNFSAGNTIILQSPAGSVINVTGMLPGGHYTVIVEDTTSRTYTFSGCSTSYFQPANAATTASSKTVYDIIFRGNGSCFIKWSTGYM